MPQLSLRCDQRARAPGEKADKADSAAAGDEKEGRKRRSDRDNNDYGPQGAARYALLAFGALPEAAKELHARVPLLALVRARL